MGTTKNGQDNNSIQNQAPPIFLGSDKVFADCDKLLTELISCLKKGEKLIQHKYRNIQKKSDVKQGIVYMRESGLYLPLSAIDHKILYNGYEAVIYDGFLKLYSYAAHNLENKLTELAYRTLLELSFYRLQVLFDHAIPVEQRDHFKLILLLVDYATMSDTHPEHAKNYEKLLGEFESLLSDREKAAFHDAKKQLTQGSPDDITKAVVKIRRIILAIQSNLYGRTTNMEIFPKHKIRGIMSAFSHMSHGNALLLMNAFGNKGHKNQHKLRTYANLFFSGVNACNWIAKYLEDERLSKQCKAMTDNYQSLTPVFNEYWRIIELDKK